MSQDTIKKNAIEAYQKNPNKTAIGRQFGVSARTIGRWLAEADLPSVAVEPVEQDEPQLAPIESWVMTANSVVIKTPEGLSTLGAGHQNYMAIREALFAGDFEKASTLINIPKAIEKLSHGDITVENGKLFYQGFEVRNVVSKLIIAGLAEGEINKKALLFLENLMENPSADSVEQLWGFLEAGNMPITDDGHFLAYKRVREDYKDCHSGTIDNSVGQVVKMPRNMVQDDKDRTCSAGLHFCSEYYLGHFGGANIMVLKINPRDVVSIPTDYKESKGRCCLYEVIGQIRDPKDIVDFL